MNINLMNDLNLTTTHQSVRVGTDLTTNNDCFQQLLRLNENQSDQGKKTINGKLTVTDDAHEDNDHDVDMFMTTIYPFNVQNYEQEKQALASSQKRSDIPEILNANSLDNLSSETLMNEQATQLLTSIYDSEDVINKVTSQTEVMSLSNDKKAKKGDLAHKKVASIKGKVNNLHVNQENNAKNASDIMRKLAAHQTPFITNNHNKDGIVHSNQEHSLLTHANGQSLLLSPTNVSATSATLNLPTQPIMQWQTSLSEQIIMFNRQGIQTAEIKLHPQALGSLHIKLAMNNDKMNLHMMAAHSVVKGMLESALPFLKTSLEDQGIMLEQANIGDFSMMNDSQQSAMHQQAQNNPIPTVQTLDASDVGVEQIIVENSAHNSGLSIFA
ncbi:flagellar hook-length control protein FliK [Gilliamella sp. App4-10]|uniref:flagellar hook-length control protein FliK n=1 Tax=Gilliamella sp. App4-10 TaxID=3120231 RepID=UPI00080DFD1E|nr:flagellar hook-length control protein FliK [Gilliamella apicola]OCG21328.1 hypothetical protein A9G23_04690 [Gilliamella apicola]